MARPKKVHNSFSVKLIQVNANEWVAEVYKDDVLVKKFDQTIYNGAVAFGTQFLLRAPYAYETKLEVTDEATA